MAGYVSEAVIKRLPGYYRHLKALEAEGVTQISSRTLGERMNLKASQIRQDINCVGGFGRQGYGYAVSELRARICTVLGLDAPHSMIIVGVGNIGSAVASYQSFRKEGFEVVALFDIDPAKIGALVDGLQIQSADDIAPYLDAHSVDIAVIALPANHAQRMAELLVSHGVRALWNFAPVDLATNGNVPIVNVHLSESLQTLSYKLAHRGESDDA